MRLARAVGYLWSSPYGVLGLLAWVVFRLGGASTVACGCALDCSGTRFGRWMWGRGWSAFTLGWTILVWDPAPPARLFTHELRHVSQALVLGPLYPVAYLLCWFGAGLWMVAAAIVGRAYRGQGWGTYRVLKVPGAVLALGYHFNPFERDARRAAGESDE